MAIDSVDQKTLQVSTQEFQNISTGLNRKFGDLRKEF